ncbi:hypothetical protein ACGF3G_49865 [Streptomyces sp. NPDC048179]|uniref:hypothetical protein n=1 Tax=Streptomyces sp. NPDC048179 TaxID=3365506 RepID=UPI003716DCA8
MPATSDDAVVRTRIPSTVRVPVPSRVSKVVEAALVEPVASMPVAERTSWTPPPRRANSAETA